MKILSPAERHQTLRTHQMIFGCTYKESEEKLALYEKHILKVEGLYPGDPKDRECFYELVERVSTSVLKNFIMLPFLAELKNKRVVDIVELIEDIASLFSSQKDIIPFVEAIVADDGEVAKAITKDWVDTLLTPDRQEMLVLR